MPITVNQAQSIETFGFDRLVDRIIGEPSLKIDAILAKTIDGLILEDILG